MRNEYSLDPVLTTLTNEAGMSVTIMDWGATIISIKVPVAGEAKPREILLGVKDPAKWSEQNCFFNATIGRYANRIAHSSFDLEGKHYVLSSGALHCLHGGIQGFDKQRFEITKVSSNAMTLQLHSADGDMGFTGNFDLTVDYILGEDNSLTIKYLGTCDKVCPACITNHAYFNLNGHNSSVLQHQLQLNSEAFLELDENAIPTGKVIEVKDYPTFDFRKSKTIGQDFLNDDQQLAAKGYDHPFLLDGDLTKPAGSLTSEDGKLTMQLFTDYPAVQIYSGNYINADLDIPARDDNQIYQNQSAICLEPEYYPDAPHLPQFKDQNPLCGPNANLQRTIKYKFN